MATPLSIFWTLWRERKKIVFEGVDISINKMKSTFLSNLWSWVNMYCLERPRSLCVGGFFVLDGLLMAFWCLVCGWLVVFFPCFPVEGPIVFPVYFGFSMGSFWWF